MEIHSLAERWGVSEHTCRNLLRDAILTLWRDLEELESAAGEGDPGRLSVAAHAIGGTALSVGLEELAEITGRMEALPRSAALSADDLRLLRAGIAEFCSLAETALGGSPDLDSSKVASPPAGEQSPSSKQDQLEVLVVENNPVTLGFLADLLEREGYRVQCAEDGLQALQVLEELHPDVMLVDLVMPNIDGEKLCRIVRRRKSSKNVYLVVLSAIAAERRPDTMATYADAWIAKGPFETMSGHVLAAIRSRPGRHEKHRPAQVLGIEGSFPREVTRELLSTIAHYRTVLENLTEGILEVNSERNIVYANQRALALCDREEEDLLAVDFVSLFHPSYQDGLRHLFEQVEDRPLCSSELDPFELGSRQVKITFVSIEDEPAGHVAIFLDDITERRRDEQRRLQLERQLHNAQRLESLGVLAAGIAHDFNNLLMGVMGNAELLKEDLGDNREMQDQVNDILAAAQHAADLSRQMLVYAGRGQVVLEQVELSTLMKEMAQLLRRSVPKKTAIRLELGSNLRRIQADPAQLRQVIMNLLLNASEAIGDKAGTIELTTESRELDRSFLSSTYVGDGLPEGRYICVEVRDTGIGMDEETAARLFEPFFTTKFPGRGLGLASVLGIVRSHRGLLKVDSSLGRGTTILVGFPARETSRVQEMARPSQSRWSGSGRILVVDDEEIVRKSASRMLRTLGFDPVVASSGAEAVEIIGQDDEAIKLVLLDLMMPEMDGEECFEELRAINSDLRIIVSSGYTEEETKERFASKGLNGFLEKPYRLRALREQLQDVLSDEIRDPRLGSADEPL